MFTWMTTEKLALWLTWWKKIRCSWMPRVFEKGFLFIFLFSWRDDRRIHIRSMCMFCFLLRKKAVNYNKKKNKYRWPFVWRMQFSQNRNSLLNFWNVDFTTNITSPHTMKLRKKLKTIRELQSNCALEKNLNKTYA